MIDGKWSDIFLSVRDGESGPWMCPVCDFGDPTVELGQGFKGGALVKLTLYCNACMAEAAVLV